MQKTTPSGIPGSETVTTDWLQAVGGDEPLFTSRGRPCRPFIRGPIPLEWMQLACRLNAAALAIYIQWKVGLLGKTAKIALRPAELVKFGLGGYARRRIFFHSLALSLQAGVELLATKLFKGQPFLFRDLEESLLELIKSWEGALTHLNDLLAEVAHSDKRPKGERVAEIDISGLKQSSDKSRAERWAGTWLEDAQKQARMAMMEEDGTKQAYAWEVLREQVGLQEEPLGSSNAASSDTKD